MTLDGLERRTFRHFLLFVLLVAVVGILHRRAGVDAWIDDRALVAAPAWYQMAAPLWHATVAGSDSIASSLLSVLDPLTNASTSGDVRALAATLTAFSAAMLLLILQRAAVPLLVALPLCFVTVSPVLPVTSSVSVAYALQMLSTAALILTWAARHWRVETRLGLLAALSLLGTLNHASCLPFALGIWVMEWIVAGRAARRQVLVVGAVALITSLLAMSWLMAHEAASPPFGSPLARPDATALAVALFTGRFGFALQPPQDHTVTEMVAACLPGPALLCVPLALLGFVPRVTRLSAVLCVATALVTALFSAATWLPDLHVAVAPVRLIVVLVMGLGLAWLASQPLRGTKALALVTSVLVGFGGYLVPSDENATVLTAETHAFAERASDTIGTAAWTSDHLAVTRAMLGRHAGLAAARVPLDVRIMSAVPRDRAVVAVGNANVSPDTPGTSNASFDVPYPSATWFLATQPARTWIAVAVHGSTAGEFCRDILTRLGVDAGTETNVTVLARVGDDQGVRARITGVDRLDVEYGRRLAGAREPVPAHFIVTNDPQPRIIVNQREVGDVRDGMALATFDPWTGDTNAWRIGSCDAPVLPLIGDRRLNTRYLSDWDPPGHTLRVPSLISTSLRVRLGDDAGDWLGDGWNGPEGAGDTAFRWTSAPQAHVNVAVARPQPVLVHLNADLATAPNQPNGLAVRWNGAVVRPLAPWTDGPDGQWIVPAAAVRRGVNVLTIHVATVVSPAATGAGPDTRTLGALVHSLSFEPVPPH